MITAGNGADLIFGGFGDDRIQAGTGNDIIVGDSGSAVFASPGVYSTVQTSDPLYGGNDTIIAGTGRDILVGGTGNDTITTSNSNSLVLGDDALLTFGAPGFTIAQFSPLVFGAGASVDQSGNVTFTAGILTQVQSLDTGYGGSDLITAGTGANAVIGGDGNDTIITGNTASVLLGDSGQFNWSLTGVLLTAQTIDAVNGGDDTVTAGNGANVILGGAGSDAITAGSGNNIIVGDNGAVTWLNQGAATPLASVAAFDPVGGGYTADDTIKVGAGNNVILGGAGADKITAGTGLNVILGDDGQLVWSGGYLSKVQSLNPGLGGNDTIAVDANQAAGAAPGSSIVIGGAGGDTITGGDGADIVIGDNGEVDYLIGQLGLIGTVQTTLPTSGGDDTITLGNGPDVVLGGVGNDTITAGTGNDVLFGDDGVLSYNQALVSQAPVGTPTLPSGIGAAPQYVTGFGSMLASATSSDYGAGGNDVVTVGSGSNVVLGGTGADTIVAGSGNNLIIGDNGQTVFSGNYVTVQAFDPADGGGDIITAGNGNNDILGGVGNDTISAGTGNNAIVGDDGVIRLAANSLNDIQNTDQSYGGNDAITTVGTTLSTSLNVVLGGAGNDAINGGDGSNIVIGDNGDVSFAAANILSQIVAFDPVSGGANPVYTADDQITLGNGNDFVLGGTGSDKIKLGNGRDLAFGDDGLITFTGSLQLDANSIIAFGIGLSGNVFAGGIVTQWQSMNPGVGGADTITAGSGNDLLVGGAGNDNLSIGGGNGILFGDDGTAAFTQAGMIGAILSTNPGDAGNNILSAGNGRIFALGGYGSDQITLGNGNDVVFGDGGSIGFSAFSNLPAWTNTLDPSVGGNDTITLGSGNDIVFGGAGGDHISATSGNDVAIGDNGTVGYSSPGVISVIVTSDPSYGGDDAITLGGGTDIAFGGVGNDTIVVGGGNDQVVGDDGQIGFTNGAMYYVVTLDPQAGGNDAITAGGGRDILVGGIGNDTINAGDGSDIVFGDDGVVNFATPGVLSIVQTLDPGHGGNDTIGLGNGNDYVLGGAGRDAIVVGNGNDAVFGDDGAFEFTPNTPAVAPGNTLVWGFGTGFSGGQLTTTITTDSVGDNDTITAGSGTDLIIGGAGSDTITAGGAGVGADVIIGDDGLAYAVPSTGLFVAQTIDPTIGGADSITTTGSFGALLGGIGGDTIQAGNGKTAIIGDDGGETFTFSQLVWIGSIDTAGGDDTITAGNADDTVIGGVGADKIRLGTGRDIVIGDDGQASFAIDGAISGITTADATMGGNDTITLGDGNNLVFGGFGDDTITVGGGSNVVVGDAASANFADTTVEGDSGTYAFSGRQAAGPNGTTIFSNGLLVSIIGTDPGVGGNDIITAGGGQNLILGGLGNDTINVGDGANIILGDEGVVNYSQAGVIQTVMSFNTGVAGGADTITAGKGNNIIMGGLGADQITAGNGNNIVFGDDGVATFSFGSTAAQPGHANPVVSDSYVADTVTTDPSLGGNDAITVGNGNNLVFGGAGNDAITAGNGPNVILGGNGEVAFSYGYILAGAASNNSNFAGTDTITTGTGKNVVLQGPTNQNVAPKQLPLWQHDSSAAPAATAARAVAVDAGEIHSLVLEAEAIWAAALGPNDARLAALQDVTVEVGTLPKGALGVTYGDVIVIDATADGWGWYLGGGNDAFSVAGSPGVFDADAGSAAAGHMDLLSTLLHEMGNAMGMPEDTGNDVAGQVLSAGERRLPSAPIVLPSLSGSSVPGARQVGSAAQAPAWLDDFLNSGTDGLGRPNAGLRVRVPV